MLGNILHECLAGLNPSNISLSSRLTLKCLGYTLIPAILVDTARDSGIRIVKKRIHRYTCDPTAQF
ncbi:MAG TPA: hypothetical protein VJ439_00570 [Candidatus Bathyarchaeia archaeon]|nr:hypothetical protein [Candidatus Bathyarchaeia archaeon]